MSLSRGAKLILGTLSSFVEDENENEIRRSMLEDTGTRTSFSTRKLKLKHPRTKTTTDEQVVSSFSHVVL